MTRVPVVLTCALATLLAGACKREARDIGEPLKEPNQYSGNAFGTSEGARLYQNMNCVGCHANGGGAIGPPLMDAKWFYGNSPDSIFRTIQHGRPNGMPAFGGRLNDQQMWKLVAYVQTMSGEGPKWSRPGRKDHMMMRIPEQQTGKEHPIIVPPGQP